MEQGIADRAEGRTVTAASALEIGILPSHRGQGLSSVMLQAMRSAVSRQGLADLLAPVRPNQKPDFPRESMEAYLARRRDDGLPSDDWLRVHVRAGGEILGPCSTSMRIPGSIESWKSWTTGPVRARVPHRAWCPGPGRERRHTGRLRRTERLGPPPHRGLSPAQSRSGSVAASIRSNPHEALTTTRPRPRPHDFPSWAARRAIAPTNGAGMSQGAVFECRNVSVSFGTRFGVHMVLEDLDLVVGAGHRVALVGENGSGKSTLLQVLAGRRSVDAGSVTWPDRVGAMDQVPPWPPATRVAEVLAQSVRWARELLHQVEVASAEIARHHEDLGTAARFDGAVAAVEAAGAWRAEERLDSLTERYLPGIGRDSRVDSISGGERGRLQLVQLLAGRPDALLLDEPTNHLDDRVVELLTRDLLDFPGPILFASHDRQFIEDVATGVLDLDPSRHGPVVRSGGWTSYRRHRDAGARQWAADFGDQRTAEDQARSLSNAATRDRKIARTSDNDKFIPHRKAQQASATRASRRRRAERDLGRLQRGPHPQAAEHAAVRGMAPRPSSVRQACSFRQSGSRSTVDWPRPLCRSRRGPIGWSLAPTASASPRC